LSPQTSLFSFPKDFRDAFIVAEGGAFGRPCLLTPPCASQLSTLFRRAVYHTYQNRTYGTAAIAIQLHFMGRQISQCVYFQIWFPQTPGLTPSLPRVPWTDILPPLWKSWVGLRCCSTNQSLHWQTYSHAYSHNTQRH